MADIKRKPGRPFGTLKYDNLADLEAGIDKYFKACEPHLIYDDSGNVVYNKDGSPAMTEQQPYTMSGLAYALDIDRHTLLGYGDKEDYYATVSRARRKVEEWTSKALFSRDMSRGAEFSLKNNHGFKDQQDINLESNKPLEVNINIIE